MPSAPSSHDPGGKRTFPLMKGCRGSALMHGDREEYRPLLVRSWSANPDKTWLWVGMNPSTALATVDDPTIRKELGFTIAGRGNGYVKCNIMDYRATKPIELRAVKAPCSDINLGVIRTQASLAHVIVAAWGAVDDRYQYFAAQALIAMRQAGKPIYCLGTTDDGRPRHPLYVKGGTNLEIFNGQF